MGFRVGARYRYRSRRYLGRRTAALPTTCAKVANVAAIEVRPLPDLTYKMLACPAPCLRCGHAKVQHRSCDERDNLTTTEYVSAYYPGWCTVLTIAPVTPHVLGSQTGGGIRECNCLGYRMGAGFRRYLDA